MTTREQPTELHQFLTFFEVPEGEGHMQFTVVYRVFSDSSIKLPDGFTPEQEQAIKAYLSYNNKHMHTHKGNSLTVMEEAEGDLYWAAIDSLKSPYQKHKELLQDFVLSQHVSSIERCTPFVSWFDEVWDGHKKDYVEAGYCTQNDALFEIRITESFDNTFSYRHPQISIEYIVAESPAQELTVIQSRCNLIDCKKFRDMLSEDE